VEYRKPAIFTIAGFSTYSNERTSSPDERYAIVCHTLTTVLLFFMTRRLLWSVSLLALLLLQQLGLGHRYAHAQRLEGMGSVSASSFESSSGLLVHDSGLCVLLDHLAAGDAHTPPVPLLLAIAFLAFSYLSVLAGHFIARWAALFQARGPPASL
jgi:hypothetical protein